MFDYKYRALISVCETGSFTKAAKALSLTQPAISNQMKAIEKELHIRLFYRNGGSLKLTPEGEIAAKYARRAMGLYEKMNTALLDKKNHTTHVSVGIAKTSESGQIAKVLACYCNEHPDIKMTLVTDSLKNIIDRIKTYDISFAIVDGHIEDKHCTSILLDTDSLILAVSGNSPLSTKERITVSELKKERMILRLPDSETRTLFLSHLEHLGLSIDDFNIYLQVDHVETIKELVEHDLGVSVLPKSACLEEIRKGTIVALPISGLSMIRETSLIYPSDFEHVSILSDIISLYHQMKH